MKVIYFSLLFLLIYSCEKERCYTIEGKEIINGEYYFLLDNSSTGNRNNYSNNNDNLYTGVPDPYGTGKVDKETYESTGIGEKYCQ
jgi:hypothetical protein|tara:strand:+ start:3088 stop:3345 length:258 start_codon:yes stop_codon:yes gene_type:complete